MLARDVMTREVVSVNLKASLAQAIALMLEIEGERPARGRR